MIGERIQELRKSKGMTQQEFADSLSVPRSTIAGYEADKREPISATISLICQKFGVNEVWLRTGEGDMYQSVSIEEELAGIFGTAMSGDMSAKSRMIRAFAKMPEQYYPLLEEAVLEYAKKLTDETDK